MNNSATFDPSYKYPKSMNTRIFKNGIYLANINFINLDIYHNCYTVNGLVIGDTRMVIQDITEEQHAIIDLSTLIRTNQCNSSIK